MIASFIVRLVDGDGALLSWTEVLAEARPQGRPRSCLFVAKAPSQFVIERDGIATDLVVHWPDLDLVRKTPMLGNVPVQVGQSFAFHWIEPVWMVKGAESDIPLAPVTMRRHVVLSPPTAALGVRAT
jgi:hypothetical protein